ncbi:fumarylacetoacetate hydrolase family protein [Novosphingobium sp.]|uniref:fumarylacetoacetate hydrolase family protein n=1 Tax=Novosphingobium sp. TaxID=1874826 RepID=UPI003BA8AF5D
MKLASYLLDGAASFGIVEGDAVFDAGPGLRARFGTLKHALGALDELVQGTAGQQATAHLSELTLLPPIPDPGRILCIGRNYRADTLRAGLPIPDYPILFSRFADTQVGHGQPLAFPSVSEQYDWEGELAFVIGKSGRHIPPERAFDHIAGYACYNDGSVRDYQRHTSQDLPGKNFWHSGAFGPWLVTKDEIADPADLVVTSRVNGELMQRGEVADFIFPIPVLVSYLSTIFPLEPGDVIATGTPLGCGTTRDPKVWLKPGDLVEVEIAGIGTLANRVAEEVEILCQA